MFLVMVISLFTVRAMPLVMAVATLVLVAILLVAVFFRLGVKVWDWTRELLDGIETLPGGPRELLHGSWNS